MKTFFISDLHFGHRNIAKRRGFSSLEEMEAVLINNWNKTVGKKDRVFILGDFALGDKSEHPIEILSKLKGRKFLIKGNHDHWAKRKDAAAYFEWIKDYHSFTYGKHFFVLCHFPIASWDRKHYGSIHLHGHTHEFDAPLLDLKNVRNVCVEKTDMKPIEIKKILKEIGE